MSLSTRLPVLVLVGLISGLEHFTFESINPPDNQVLGQSSLQLFNIRNQPSAMDGTYFIQSKILQQASSKQYSKLAKTKEEKTSDMKEKKNSNSLQAVRVLEFSDNYSCIQ